MTHVDQMAGGADDIDECIVPYPAGHVKDVLMNFAGETTVHAGLAGIIFGNRYRQASELSKAVIECQERTSDGGCLAGRSNASDGCPLTQVEKLRKKLVKGVVPDPGGFK